MRNGGLRPADTGQCPVRLGPVLWGRVRAERPVWSGEQRRALLRYGVARQGAARDGWMGQAPVSNGTVRAEKPVRSAMASRGLLRFGLPRFGCVCSGGVCPGAARHGKVGSGMGRHGRVIVAALFLQ